MRKSKNIKKRTKIKPFTSKYNWGGINFSSKKADSKMFEKNNVSIALHVLCAEKEKIYPSYVSIYNLVKNKLFF